MSFLKAAFLQPRLTYVSGGSDSFKFPQGNLFTNIKFLQKTKINVVGGAASNAPDYQVWRLAREVQFIRGNDTRFSLSGEEMAVLFSAKNGVNAVDNAAMAGAIANNVAGQHYLEIPPSPFDAAKPQDLMIDTRNAKWTIKVLWRDAKALGTFFATMAGTVDVTSPSDNYIEIEFEKVELTSIDPTKPDALVNTSPLLRMIKSDTVDVLQNKSDFVIDLSENIGLRNIALWTTHETVANQEQGNNGILSGNITLRNTNGKTFGTVSVEMLRQQTSQLMALGTSTPAGLYIIPLLSFGSSLDAIYTDSTNKMELVVSVTKLANNTRIHVIEDSQIQQNRAG